MSKQLVAFVLLCGFVLVRTPLPALGDVFSSCTAQDSPLRNELMTTTICSDHGAAVAFTSVSNTQSTSVDYVCTHEGGENITGSPWNQRTSDKNVRHTVNVTEQLQPGTNCTFYVCYWYYSSFTPVFGRESPASCITDTDECATNNGGCEFNCVNTIGSFNCSCPTGYNMDEDGFNCNETNECTTNNGGCEQMCNNTIGSFYCSCRTGYLLDGNGFNCSDINECENGDDNCHENAKCTNTEGSFTCSCNSGYTGDGVICTNINECNTDNGGCEHSCTDTIGSFNCNCDVGYLLDRNGFNCSSDSFLPTQPPSIVAPPQPVVTSVADGVQHKTTFICTAVGVPTPHISWMHNMQNVSKNGRFQVTVTEDGRNHTRSTLTINSLTTTDSGIIQCVADNHFGNVSVDTTLSVLTDDFQLAVVVTAEGKLVLTVTLQTAIPGPVRLRIKYTWVVQPDTVERTTSRTFENSREMVHEESEVPFQQFRLQVALVVGRVVGPFVPDLENATAITLPPLPSSLAVPSSVLTIALLVLVPFSILLILVISVSVPAAILKRRKRSWSRTLSSTNFHQTPIYHP